jgi:hypothetical protein
MSLLRDPKRLVTMLLAGVAGLFVLIDFMGGGQAFSVVAGLLVDWAAVITSIALLLGIASVTGSHLQRIRQRSADWIYSLVLLLGMLAVIVVGIFFPIPTEQGGITFPPNLAQQPIRYFFQAVYEPIAGSLLALLAFFSLSAALRAFRRRSPEAIVIVVVAALVLVAQLPPLAALPGVGVTFAWLNDYLALAGARGLLIGAAIGALVAGVRVLIGFDMPYIDR